MPIKYPKIPELKEKGVLRHLDEFSLETLEPQTTKQYGIKLQSYLIGSRSLIPYVDFRVLADEPDVESMCPFDAELMASELGDLTTTHWVLTDLIKMGSLADIETSELKRIIRMDMALGNVL